ncbi:MAG: hypothetical protein D3910_21030 [Candidatus Electrothrix sp. ATG2]|nr:hypothetical protein [Candidatus Electrothrix sp. ATG2]
MMGFIGMGNNPMAGVCGVSMGINAATHQCGNKSFFCRENCSRPLHNQRSSGCKMRHH